jgi:hypothetical protein
MDARRFPEFRSLVTIAVKEGWTVEMTGKNHWRWVPKDPCQTILVVSGTPANGDRFVRNLKADLRRRGLGV